MKTFSCFVLLITAMICRADPQATREWTSLRGDKINAVFLSEKNGSVLLKTPDGKPLSIKISALSNPDQAFITEATYVPKKWEIKSSFRGGLYYSRKDSKEGPFIRDSIFFNVKDENAFDNRLTEITNMTVNELGNVLTNKYSKAIVADGRFVCVHWTVKSLSDREHDVNFPIVSDLAGAMYNAKEKDDVVDFMGAHCPGRNSEAVRMKLSPNFSVNCCNIFDIPKNMEVAYIYFAEIGYAPTAALVSLKRDNKNDKIPSWKKEK